MPSSVGAQTSASPPTSIVSPEDALRVPEKSVWAMHDDIYGHWVSLIATAAKQGNAEAQYRLGVELARAESYQDALVWLTKSATQDYVLAQVLLGDLYLSGKQIPVDYAEALMWLTKAGAHGNVDAEAYLGYMYENGYGVTPDETVALSWFEKAAAQGDSDAKDKIRIIKSRQAAAPAARRNIPPALAFECILQREPNIGKAMKSGSEADAESAQRAYEACLRSNWRRLFGDRPFPGD
jgi:TPR repeat protein